MLGSTRRRRNTTALSAMLCSSRPLNLGLPTVSSRSGPCSRYQQCKAQNGHASVRGYAKHLRAGICSSLTKPCRSSWSLDKK